MKIKSILADLFNWMQTTEMFVSQGKRLPGKWILKEYYTETENELIHVQEAKLEELHCFWKVEFSEDGKYWQDMNLTVPLLVNLLNGEWSRVKNYITIMHPEDYRKNVEFQFAINKNELRLLKKDISGKIEFFGFFAEDN